MIRALSNGDILVRGILLVRVQCTTHASGNTKRTYKNTRTNHLVHWKSTHDAQYSHHSSRETRKLFKVNLVVDFFYMCDHMKEMCARSVWEWIWGSFQSLRPFVRVKSYTRNNHVCVKGHPGTGRWRTSLSFGTIHAKRFCFSQNIKNST